MTNAELDVDIVIVGSRVAGSILAASLGQHEYRILMLDKDVFPKTTLSTHFFRGDGLGKTLVELDLLDAVKQLSPVLLTKEYYYRNGGSAPRIAPPQTPGELGYSLSIRREYLDDILLQKAKENKNLRFISPARVIDLNWDEDQCVGLIFRAENKQYRVKSRIVVGADGRNSTVSKKVPVSYEYFEKNHRCIFYQYVTDFPGINGQAIDGTEYYTTGDKMSYVFPSDQGVTCIAMSLPVDKFEEIASNINVNFQTELSKEPLLFERFKRAHIQSKVFAYSGHDNYMRIPAGKGWALLGDAGMHVDPWSGHGMDLAAAHAKLLANSICHKLGSCDNSLYLDDYHQQRNLYFTQLYHQVVGVSKDLSILLKTPVGEVESC